MVRRICFVAPTAYSIISGDRSVKIVGGAELQQATLAKALAARGYHVSMICMDHGQPEGERIHGVTIHKCYAPNAGLPVIRFVSPRLTTMWRAMKRADAEIYIRRAASMLTGIVAHFATSKGRLAIFAGANDPDFVRPTPKVRYFRDRYLFEYGIRHVDQIVVQNQSQLELCRKNYGRDAVLIRNCVAPPARTRPNAEGYVLWVATIRAAKQPGICLDLAERLPHIRFKMIGGAARRQDALFRSISERSNQLANLEFLGFVPYADINQYFDGARLFVNTSAHEGFPNTLLQAWSREIPVVSFLDFDAKIQGNPVSLVVDSPADMADKIDVLMRDDQIWRHAGRRASAYCSRYHSVETAVSRYERLFSDMKNDF